MYLRRCAENAFLLAKKKIITGLSELTNANNSKNTNKIYGY